MANEFINPTKVVRTLLAALEREVVLPRLVFSDSRIDFRAAKDYTVTLSVPAYAVADSRTLGAGTPITIGDVAETSVDVTLEKDVYKGVNVTDENMTLDIVSFTDQVLRPIIRSVARGLEDYLAGVISAATFDLQVGDVDEDDPYDGIVDARKALADARVPVGERFLLVGSSFEAALLKSERFAKFDGSGPDAKTAREEAFLGRIAGFSTFPCPVLDPEKAIAMHRTAVAMGNVAPVKPDGATWGTQQTTDGLAVRIIKDYDPANVQDRVVASSYIGATVVTDNGTIGEDGIFTPSEDGGEDDVVVRAVELSLDSLGS